MSPVLVERKRPEARNLPDNSLFGILDRFKRTQAPINYLQVVKLLNKQTGKMPPMDLLKSLGFSDLDFLVGVSDRWTVYLGFSSGDNFFDVNKFFDAARASVVIQNDKTVPLNVSFSGLAYRDDVMRAVGVKYPIWNPNLRSVGVSENKRSLPVGATYTSDPCNEEMVEHMPGVFTSSMLKTAGHDHVVLADDPFGGVLKPYFTNHYEMSHWQVQGQQFDEESVSYVISQNGNNGANPSWQLPVPKGLINGSIKPNGTA